MRNETFTLPAHMIPTMLSRAGMLREAASLSRPVTFDYAATKSSPAGPRTGTVVSVGGDLATNKGHAVLDTDKGPRTFSLYLMSNVRGA
jgi:hypothetical protein